MSVTTYSARLLCALALIAPAAASAQTAIGIPGSHTVEADEACRNYELEFTLPDAHRSSNDPLFTDLWWTVGVGEENAVGVRLPEPRQVASVEIHFSGFVLDSAMCAGEVEVLSGGQSLGAVDVPDICRNTPPGSMFVAAGRAVLDSPASVGSLQLVDGVGAADARPGTGYITVTSVILHDTDQLGPTAIAVTPQAYQALPTTGIGPGGWTWEVGEQGAFVLQPDGTREPLDVGWSTDARELWSVPRFVGTEVFFYAPSDSADDANELRVVDAASGEVSTLATLPSRIENAVYDACFDHVHVYLADGSERWVTMDGQVLAAESQR